MFFFQHKYCYIREEITRIKPYDGLDYLVLGYQRFRRNSYGFTTHPFTPIGCAI